MSGNRLPHASPRFRVTDAIGRVRGLVITRLTGTRTEQGDLSVGLLDADLKALEDVAASTAGEGVLLCIACDAPAAGIVKRARHAMERTFEKEGAVLLVRAQSEQTARAFLAAVQADYATTTLTC